MTRAHRYLMREMHFNWTDHGVPAPHDHQPPPTLRQGATAVSATSSTKASVMAAAQGTGASRTGVAQHNDLKVRLRFLSLTRWPRVANRSEGRCLYHPFAHADREGVFRRAGWWYL